MSSESVRENVNEQGYGDLNVSRGSMDKNDSHLTLQNRFEVLNEELQDGGPHIPHRAVGGVDRDEGFSTAGRSKRQRINTGDKYKTQDYAPETIPNQPLEISALSSDEKMNLMLSKMVTYESKINSIETKIDRVVNLIPRVDFAEKTLRKQDERITLLEYKSMDLEARSRRNNLLFKGFPEERNEDCKAKIKLLLKNQLELKHDIVIDRAHRLGRFSPGGSRHIIVAFSTFRETELVLTNANKMKGTTYSVSRDYPPEITRARKHLWAEYKDLRTRNPFDKVSIVYPAKIVVNGRVVRDMFPHWNTIMQGSRVHESTDSLYHKQSRHNVQNQNQNIHSQTRRETNTYASSRYNIGQHNTPKSAQDQRRSPSKLVSQRQSRDRYNSDNIDPNRAPLAPSINKEHTVTHSSTASHQQGTTRPSRSVSRSPPGRRERAPSRTVPHNPQVSEARAWVDRGPGDSDSHQSEEEHMQHCDSDV